MEKRSETLNQYLVGWLGYYQLAEPPLYIQSARCLGE
ncbi:group II intron maturase-specific domain-containing protein [Amphibacillus jilinensis]|nr:group II intron maturase-specific domain-containing protein [Amphibacillus jilinensis]